MRRSNSATGRTSDEQHWAALVENVPVGYRAVDTLASLLPATEPA